MVGAERGDRRSKRCCADSPEMPVFSIEFRDASRTAPWGALLMLVAIFMGFMIFQLVTIIVHQNNTIVQTNL